MSFKLQNPDKADDVVETPSEDRRDFLMSRGWTLVGEDDTPEKVIGRYLDEANDWLQEAIERGAVRSADDVLMLPAVHLEDEIEEQETEEHDEDVRKGRR